MQQRKEAIMQKYNGIMKNNGLEFMTTKLMESPKSEVEIKNKVPDFFATAPIPPTSGVMDNI